MTERTPEQREQLRAARIREWADPVLRNRRLSAMRRAMENGGKNGRPLLPRPVVVRGDPVPAAEIPVDPWERMLFGAWHD